MAHTNLFSSIRKTAYQPWSCTKMTTSKTKKKTDLKKKRVSHFLKEKLWLGKICFGNSIFKHVIFKVSNMCIYVYILGELSGGSKGPGIGHIRNQWFPLSYNDNRLTIWYGMVLDEPALQGASNAPQYRFTIHTSSWTAYSRIAPSDMCSATQTS